MAIDLRLQSPGRTVMRPSCAAPLRGWRALSGLVAAVLRWREVRRQRLALLELSDHLLKDIGISRVDAVREAGRPFWDTDAEGDRGWR